MNLAWNPSTDNVGVNAYQIVRNGVTLGSVPAATLTWSDTTAGPSTTYTYFVRASDAAGNISRPGNSITVTTPAAPPPAGGPPSTGGACPAAPVNAFAACWYNNTSMAGNPAVVFTEPAINIDWSRGVPSPLVSPFNLSAKFSGWFTFENALYTFSTTASDGLRIYIDGELVMDRWRDQSAMIYNFRRYVSAGRHQITAEYYQRNGMPLVSVSWQKN